MNILFSHSLDITVLRLYAAVVLDENFEMYTITGEYIVNELGSRGSKMYPYSSTKSYLRL